MTLKPENTGSCGKRDEEEGDWRRAERGLRHCDGEREGVRALGSEHGSERFGETLEGLSHRGVAEGFHVCGGNVSVCVARCEWGPLYVWDWYLQGARCVGDSWCSCRVVCACRVPWGRVPVLADLVSVRRLVNVWSPVCGVSA